MLNNSDVQTPREIGDASITTASIIIDASSNNAGRVPTSIEDKKKKIDAVYPSSSWIDEDPYEIMKVRQLIRNHVFKNLSLSRVKNEEHLLPILRKREKECEDITIW